MVVVIVMSLDRSGLSLPLYTESRWRIPSRRFYRDDRRSITLQSHWLSSAGFAKTMRVAITRKLASIMVSTGSQVTGDKDKQDRYQALRTDLGSDAANLQRCKNVSLLCRSPATPYYRLVRISELDCIISTSPGDAATWYYCRIDLYLKDKRNRSDGD